MLLMLCPCNCFCLPRFSIHSGIQLCRPIYPKPLLGGRNAYKRLWCLNMASKVCCRLVCGCSSIGRTASGNHPTEEVERSIIQPVRIWLDSGVATLGRLHKVHSHVRSNHLHFVVSNITCEGSMFHQSMRLRISMWCIQFCLAFSPLS